MFTIFKMLDLWVWAIVAAAIGMGIWTGYLKSRKIQPKGFKWKIFGFEILFGIINGAVSGFVLGGAQTWLRSHGFAAVNPAPTAWWVVGVEYAIYFFGFDTWFYWLHRWMHNEPVYSWVHKLHHKSTAPNLFTTFSVNPLESLVNGGFVIVFLTAMTLATFPVHQQSLALILPTNIIMGLYVHSGYEFLPRWWNKSWATKWFISATFHDQHHKYFTANFGGYTTIWDRLCGTMRKKFESDFENPKGRQKKVAPVSLGEPVAEAAE